MALSALRIGLVGIDTSHSVEFTKCFNKSDDPEHVPGGRVVAAFPGGSPDFELSISRVPGYQKILSETYDVKILDTPAAVADAVDLLIIGSSDGRVHRKQFEETVGFHRPTFIDKPLAITSADASAIFTLAARENVPVMSCSALRYAENLTAALKDPTPIIGVDIFGPMAEQPTQPGLFWYGIHCVEVMQRVMGVGCKEITAVRNDAGEIITCLYTDGRMASIRGIRKGHPKFGAVLHRDAGSYFIDISGGKRSYYAGLLDAIMANLPVRKSDVKPEETLEIIRIIEAANQSRQSGKPVPLAST